MNSFADFKKKLSTFLLVITLFYLNACSQPDYLLWHKITLSFKGPYVIEEEETFLNYRLQVVFTHKRSGEKYNVAGFFAADGQTAESSADAGNIWQVHFTPDKTGLWTYQLSFRYGDSIAVLLDPKAGKSGGWFDGQTGEFTVIEQNEDLQSRDFRKKGILRYAGKHYLQHAGSEDFFLKGGAGSPENFLAFTDFDGTMDNGGTFFPALGKNQLHSFEPHVKDWQPGNPQWKDSLGRGIIGALNYIADKGLNAVYMVTMNVKGDGQDVWPWISADKRTVFDISKLAQWEVVFSHMDKKGIMLDILFTETENENLFEALDGGDFAFTRKLYYREMIARFAHHLGVTWNLGEENGHDDSPELAYAKANSDKQRKMFSNFIRAIDPYNHPIVVHNFPGDEDSLFSPLLGFKDFEGVSLQEDTFYYSEVLKWIQASDSMGRPWIVCIDEPLGWEFGLKPDIEDPQHDTARSEVLWPALMAGGAGIDWYFGWQNNASTSDLSNEDWRSRENMWHQTKIALDFFHDYLPFDEMKAANHLSKNPDVLVFAKKQDKYVVYMKTAQDVQLDIGNSGRKFSVDWFDPEIGGPLQHGSTNVIEATGLVSPGQPPGNRSKDWVALIRNMDSH